LNGGVPARDRVSSQNAQGLVAEQVAQVDSTLVLRDDNSEVYTVRYDAVNAMLLNEFLKEHRKVQQQEADIRELKNIAAEQNSVIGKQQKRIDALAAGLQKVSARTDLHQNRRKVANNE
jgi:uncharacterized coiled-coil protein SlyX